VKTAEVIAHQLGEIPAEIRKARHDSIETASALRNIGAELAQLNDLLRLILETRQNQQ